jgi:hypothetical protein
VRDKPLPVLQRAARDGDGKAFVGIVAAEKISGPVRSAQARTIAAIGSKRPVAAFHAAAMRSGSVDARNLSASEVMDCGDYPQTKAQGKGPSLRWLRQLARFLLPAAELVVDAGGHHLDVAVVEGEWGIGKCGCAAGTSEGLIGQADVIVLDRGADQVPRKGYSTPAPTALSAPGTAAKYGPC